MARKTKAAKAAKPETPAAPETVTVNCQVQSGISARLFKTHQDPNGGEPRAIAIGAATLAYGDNPGIDSEFISAWLDQNADLDAVKNGLISIQPEGNS